MDESTSSAKSCINNGITSKSNGRQKRRRVRFHPLARGRVMRALEQTSGSHRSCSPWPSRIGLLANMSLAEIQSPVRPIWQCSRCLRRCHSFSRDCILVATMPKPNPSFHRRCAMKTRSAGEFKHSQRKIMELRFPQSEITKLAARYEQEMGERDRRLTAAITQDVFPSYARNGFLTKEEFLTVCAWKTPRSRRTTS